MYPYNNYYPSTYNPQTFQKYDIVKVSGQHGAEAFQMAPNSSILLLDETAPIVWLKTTDGAGYPTLTPYSITVYQPDPPVDTKSLEERVKRIEEILYEQSNTRNAEQPETSTKPVSNKADDEICAIRF